MKITRYKCDGCHVETDNIITVKIPIRVTTNTGIHLELHDIDLCQACANDISNAYYEIAMKHNHSGVRGLSICEEDAD